MRVDNRSYFLFNRERERERKCLFVVSRAALFLTLSKRVIIITPLRRKVRLFILNFLFSSLFFCVTCLKTPVDKSTISRHFFIYIHFKEHVCHLQFRCFLGPKVPTRVLLSMRVRARVRLRVIPISSSFLF